MPRRSSSDSVCCLRAMIACYPRHFSIVFAAQWPWWRAMPDEVGKCMLSKGDDGMPPPMVYDNMCFSRDMMACHTRCSPIVCDVQERWSHAMPDVAWLCMFSKGADGIQRPTSSYCVCCRRAIFACHAWHRPTVCAAQGRWLHAMIDIVQPCVLPKVHMGISTPDVVRSCVLSP